VEAASTLSLPSFGGINYSLESSNVESDTSVSSPSISAFSQLNSKASESLSETNNPTIYQTHNMLTESVEAVSFNSIPFFTGEELPVDLNGIPVKESVVFNVSNVKVKQFSQTNSKTIVRFNNVNIT